MNILCIDDGREMVRLARVYLGRYGHDVYGAGNGNEGLAMIPEVAPDVILLDIMMPGMTGWEVVDQLQADAATRDIPVIVVTALASQAHVQRGAEHPGIKAYITKPFAPDDLMRQIELATGQRS